MAIENKTTFEAWLSALKTVYGSGIDFTDTNKRRCRQFLNLIVKITNPENDFDAPLERLEKFKKWVIPPRDELTNVIMSKKSSPVYMYAYGPRMFNYRNTFDQINNYIIPLLKQDPVSRKAVVSLWDVESDSVLIKKEVPGLVLLDFKIQNDRLHLTAVIRSNDMFFGWPANIHQLFTIQKYVADKLGIPTGTLTTFSVSAHIFHDNFEDMMAIIEEEGR